jgi:hypothetical protein
MNENKQKFIGNIIVAGILSIAIIASCLIGVIGLAQYKKLRDEIDITGSIKQQIVSDLIVWSGYFDVTTDDVKVGYDKLEADKEKVKQYLLDKGFTEEELIFSSISVSEQYDRNEYGAIYYDKIIGYKLGQTVTISSSEIDKVSEVSRSATELLDQGVQFQSYAPEYYYTKLDELKVTMLADATKDATKRAEMITENAGSKLGDLKYAKVSKIKIAPLYSTPDDYSSDYGYYSYSVDNDTVSLEKEVTVTVFCTFEIKN